MRIEPSPAPAFDGGAPDDERRRLLALLGCRAALAASAGLLAGCGGSDGPAPPPPPPPPADVTPPEVRSVVPADGATAVARSSVVSVAFSEAVRLTATPPRLTGPRGAVSAAATVDGVTLTMTPPRPLMFGERLELGLAGGVTDLAGNALALGAPVAFTVKPRNPALALGGTVMDSYVRRRWSSPSAPGFDVLPWLADRGFGWLRVGVTTVGNPELRGTADWWTLPFQPRYWSSLEVSGALLREGADQGLRLHAMLFLSDGPADAGRQSRPAAWAGLSEAEVAERVEAHAADVASYYRSLDLDIEIWEIGNEIDFGVCGIVLADTVPVPPGVDPVNDPVWMRDNVWVLGAPLLKAAIRGVRSVYPSARIALHVAGFGYSREDIAARGFFQSMVDLAVPFDIAALSYPYMFAGSAVPQPYFAQASFLGVLTAAAALGKAVQIVEFGYQAKPEGAVHAPAAVYPFTPAGQATFVRDLAQAVAGKVESLLYFYPDWHDGQDAAAPELEAIGLFSAPGVPRPALSVFEDIAEGRLLG